MQNQELKIKYWVLSWFAPLWRNATVGVLIALAGLLLVWRQAGVWYHAQLLANERAQVTEQLGSYRDALTFNINRQFARLEGLKAFVEANPSFENLDDYFESFAAGLFAGEEGIRNMVIAPDAVNRYVYPLKGNKAAVGHDLLNDPRPEVGEAVRRAIEKRSIVLTGPYELLQGGQGLVARQAIFQGGEFWGLASMVLDMPVVLDQAGLNARPAGLEVALRDQTGHIFYGQGAVFDSDPVIQSVPLPDGMWEIAGLPSGGWDAAIRYQLLLFRVSGLMIVVLAFIVIYTGLTRQVRLELAVRERTAELESEIIERKQAEQALEESETKFRAIFENSVDAIGVSQAGLLTMVNPAYLAMFGYDRADEFIGKSILDLIAPAERERISDLVRRRAQGDLAPSIYETRGLRRNGAEFEMEVRVSTYTSQGQSFTVPILRDITKRKRAEVALRESEARYHSLFEDSPISLWEEDFSLVKQEIDNLRAARVSDLAAYFTDHPEHIAYCASLVKILDVNRATLTLIKAQGKSDLYAGLDAIFNEASFDIFREELIMLGSGGTRFDREIVQETLTGDSLHIALSLAVAPGYEASWSKVFVSLIDITERKQAEAALWESEARLAGIVNSDMDAIISLDANQRITLFNPAAEQMFLCSATEAVGQSLDRFIPDRFRGQHHDHIKMFGHSGVTKRMMGRVDAVTITGQRTDGTEFPAEASISHTEVIGMQMYTVILRDVTQRKQAEAALQESDSRFRSFMNNNATIAWMKDEQGRHVYLSETFEKRHNVRLEDWDGKTDFEVWPREIAETFWKNDQEVLRAEEPIEIIEETKDPQGIPTYWLNFKFPFRDASGRKYIGGIGIDITERKERERELEALAAVSAASRSALTRAEMLAVIVEQTMSLTNADGIVVVLSDPLGNDAVVEAIRGELSAPVGSRIPSGQGIAGHVIATGQPYITNDLPNDPLIYYRQPTDLKSFVSMPLTTPNGTIGALQVAGHTRFTDSLISVVASLADMAASAIQRVTLYEQSLAHASELSQAYEETLAGWARALELRDEPTEGHTRRVTDLTIQLSRALGLPEQDIEHIRRGALLHDIGKMGVPDSILHKPGPLTGQEKAIMQLHPGYAYEMLSKIPFLRPALDIPYCHHEKWDGSGYPRGLNGKAIPLAARIFQVADVYDALSSDRPYRPAWGLKKVRKYIQNERGKYFDPQIVDIFLKMDLKD